MKKTYVKSAVKAVASTQLQEEIEEELKKEDPAVNKARAAINKNKKEE